MTNINQIDYSSMRKGSIRGLIAYFTRRHEILDAAQSDQCAAHNLRTTLQTVEAERDKANTQLRIAEQEYDKVTAMMQALEKANAHVYDLEEELADTKRSLQQSESRRLRITENLSALADGDYEAVYYAIKGDMDPEGWKLYFTACRNTSRSVSETFSTEDNLGCFVEMDGDALLPWLECANFGHCDWKQLDGPGGYELSENRIIDTESEAYKTYRELVFKRVVTELLFE